MTKEIVYSNKANTVKLKANINKPIISLKLRIIRIHIAPTETKQKLSRRQSN